MCLCFADRLSKREIMEPNEEQAVYQFYTIIEDPSKLILENPNLQNLFEVGEDDSHGNQVMYVALQQEDPGEEQEDEEEEEESASDVLCKEEDDACTNSIMQSMPSVKLVTLSNGQVYLTTENASDDNSPAIQPHLLTNIVNETTSTDNLDIKNEELVEESADEISNFREVQLEDGTCAIINADLWNSLIDKTPIAEPKIDNKKKFPCVYIGCGKAFTTAHHLSVHTRSHTGNRPYPCTAEGCDKAFATGYSLKAHLRTHTGEKPYGCNVCVKQFKTSGDLQKHVRTHTGEKPFKCPIVGCDKSFTTSNIRKVHIRSHTGERPYTCKVVDCGKAFASATNYKNHMRIHSGEKPYACHIENCGKRFTEYSSLYKHSAVHQPYRNFRCDFCAQYFKFEATLRLHKKTVHNIIVTETVTEFVISEDNSRPVVFELSNPTDINSVRDPLLLWAEDEEDEV